MLDGVSIRRTPRRVPDVSRIHDRDRRRDRPRPAGRARLSARHAAAALHRQSIRIPAAHHGVARRRHDGGVRSLPGVEHRLRRGAGRRRGVADRDPAVPAAAVADDPARHAAGRVADAQEGAIATSSSATCRCSAACARATCDRRSSADWMRLEGERDKDAVSAAVLSAVRSRLGLLVTTRFRNCRNYDRPESAHLPPPGRNTRSAKQAFAQICRPISQRTGEIGCWIIDRCRAGSIASSTDLLAPRFVSDARAGRGCQGPARHCDRVARESLAVDDRRRRLASRRVVSVSRKSVRSQYARV